MRKKEINNSDRLETNGRESGRMTEKAGRQGYLSKSNKETSQRRRRRGNEQASDGKKQREGKRLLVFKLADLLTDKEIKRLKAIK